jgi:hypothetical protein
MKNFKKHVLLCGLLGGLAWGTSASAVVAVDQYAAAPAALTVAAMADQLARRGRGRDDVGCDDHGTDVCLSATETMARRGRGRDDTGCDDHGTDVCRREA